MTTDELIRDTFNRTIGAFAASAAFQDLLEGRLSRDEIRGFLHNLFLPHYQSAHILAFGFALLASEASHLIKENMLEEMGEAGEEAHPKLLLRLLAGAGFSDDQLAGLIEASEEGARAFCGQQLPFPTLRDVGLAILLESALFEHFLSRYAGSLGDALRTYYAIPSDALAWFTLHGELDVRHAEESITVIQEYLRFHRIGESDLARINRAVFATNPLARRYFPVAVQPHGRVPAARIEAITIYRLHIPFREAFRHAQTERSASDAIVVRVRDDLGNVGYGEALPREYVTGEDAASVVAFIESQIAGWVFGEEFGSSSNTWDRVAAYGREWVHRVSSSSPASSEFSAPRNSELGTRNSLGWGPVVASTNTAAFCAVELALLDWAYRRAGESIAERLPPLRGEVTYSGVISAEDPEAAAALARRFADANIDQIKLKVGVGDDVARVRAVRGVAGDGARLRVDANGAWDVDTAVSAIRALLPLGIESVEQPVSHRRPDHVAALRAVREATGVRVVADESLATLADARALVEAGACDVFNVRVSKNGGLTGALAIAEMAASGGIGVQVGAQVGETAILTAAGRHLAAHLPDLEHAEGSFGTLLLSEDVAQQELRFGLGGVAPLSGGPGLGIDVRQDAIERLSVERLEITR